MFGRKCSLCGGKLNSKNVCKECGLDNTKSDKYYRMNQSSCDDMPLTHVHEDTWSETKGNNRTKKKPSVNKQTAKTVNQQKYIYQTAPAAKKTEKKKLNKEKKSTISVLVTLLLLVIGAIPTILGIFENETYTSAEPEYYEGSYDPYVCLEKEHPLEGDSLSYTLTSGEYVVGVHIAPGDYYARVNENHDAIGVTDYENSIYLYTSMTNDEEYLDDLRLFEGAVVTITSQEEIQIETNNAQTGEMPALVENFVTESYKLITDYEAEAGVDFEPGIYDISTDGDYSWVSLTIFDEGSEWDYRSYDLGPHGIHGSLVRNVVIPEGAIIQCEQSVVDLVPSEWIWTSDYMEHYY